MNSLQQNSAVIARNWLVFSNLKLKTSNFKLAEGAEFLTKVVHVSERWREPFTANSKLFLFRIIPNIDIIYHLVKVYPS